MNAARHQTIARAFRRRARQHRRLNFEKAEFVERLANFENHAMPQLDIAVQPRPAQIEIAVAQARLLARRHFVFDLKRRRLRIVQNVQPRGHHFHFARRNFRIRLLPPNHAPFHGHHEFRAQLFGLRVRLGMQLLVEHDLRDSGAVAQINKNQLPQIAPPVHPAHQHDVLLRVRRAQLAAIFCPLQISECVKHEIPLRSDSRYSSNSFSVSFFCSRVGQPLQRECARRDFILADNQRIRAPSLSARPSDFLNFISSGGSSTASPPRAICA